VWAILNDFHSAVPEGDTNSSDIKNMTLIETFGDGTNRYYLNMSGLINFQQLLLKPDLLLMPEPRYPHYLAQILHY